MNRTYSEDHILPRPVEALPELAPARARRALVERLLAAFPLYSEQAAEAIANAVVDPTEVRKMIGEPTDPQVEEIRVPVGTLLVRRAMAWSRRVVPDPRNPRIGPSRQHPFAVDPGTGGENSRFRPVPEPYGPSNMSLAPELMVDIESRHHLEWAGAQAAKFILDDNDWRSSIASQGVMESVWVVPVTYNHADGSSPRTVLTTVEGSSRVTAVHNLLSIRSADVLYEDDDQKLRAHIRKMNQAYERGATGAEQVALRCEQIPVLLLVGFRPHPHGNVSFPTAVKSLVALRHVDPPKPWGEGPENESLADEVLDELFRQKLVTETERAYFAGSCTRSEARAAHLSDDPTRRASRIVELFTTKDDSINEAIRVAVTSQSTRKRLTPKLRNELATALIVRSFPSDPARADQVRRYMRHAFAKPVHNHIWNSSDRDVETLGQQALREVSDAIVNGGEPGPASIELAVRAAYPLIVTGVLSADRGTVGNIQPDRRTPGEVLDAMRRRVDGAHQLLQALRDFAAGRSIRAVDVGGVAKRLADGSGDHLVSDSYLRGEFPPPGKTPARSGGSTPTELLRDSVIDIGELLDQLEVEFEKLRSIRGVDGTPLINVEGIDPAVGTAWRSKLQGMSDDLIFWGRTFRNRYGAVAAIPSVDAPDDEDPDAEVEEAYDASYDKWEASDEG